MTIRHLSRLRAAAIFAAPALLLPAVFAPAAHAADTALPVGLFGTADPTYDGIYRQSLALLAYVAEDVEPPTEAVEWLLDQQCDNGGFQSFRADPSAACLDSDASTWSGPDANSTSLAVNALSLLGEDDAAEAAVDFLSTLQNNDGGIAYYAGGTSDANSTAVTAMALTAFGIDPGSATSNGESLYDYLDSVQLDCSADAGDRGAYAYQAGGTLYANDLASVQATLVRADHALPVDVPSIVNGDVPVLDCGAGGTTDPAVAGAGYLAGRLAANGSTIPDAFNPGGTDWGSTRWAVMALASSGYDDPELVAAWQELDENQDDFYPGLDGKDAPGALAEMILATHAAAPYLERADLDQVSLKRQIAVGSTDTGDLLERLTATLSAAPDEPDTDPGTEPDAATDDGDKSGSGSAVPDAEATNGGTEIADTGATSVPVAAAGALLAALGGLMVLGARRFDVEQYLGA